MIIGYISSFLVAIILSLFYLGCLANDIGSYINTKLSKDKDNKVIELSCSQKNENSSNSVNLFYIPNPEPYQGVRLNFTYFVYFSHPPVKQYSTDYYYSLFTRPPPFC